MKKRSIFLAAAVVLLGGMWQDSVKAETYYVDEENGYVMEASGNNEVTADVYGELNEEKEALPSLSAPAN